jgi:hypothetical protein
MCPVPIDLVTTSASGFDPHISPARLTSRCRAWRASGAYRIRDSGGLSRRHRGTNVRFLRRAASQRPRAQPRARCPAPITGQRIDNRPRLGKDVTRSGGIRLELFLSNPTRRAGAPADRRHSGPDRLEDGASVSTRAHGCCARNVTQLKFLRVSRTSSPSGRRGSCSRSMTVSAHDARRPARRRLGAPQRHSDSREQLFRTKWLGHGVVAARIQGTYLVALGTARGEHEDRASRGRPYQATHFHPVDVLADRGQAQSSPDCHAPLLRARPARSLPWRPRIRGFASRGASVASDVGFVVYDDGFSAAWASLPDGNSADAGTRIEKRAPPRDVFGPYPASAAASSPRVMASPIPVPNDAWRAARSPVEAFELDDRAPQDQVRGRCRSR